jgi:acyl carrier protein
MAGIAGYNSTAPASLDSDGDDMTPHADAFDAFVTLVTQIVPLDLPRAAVTRDSTLAGDLGLDSISLISLMALTEERFGVSFAEHTEAVANLRTVGDAMDLIDALATARA